MEIVVSLAYHVRVGAVEDDDSQAGKSDPKSTAEIPEFILDQILGCGMQRSGIVLRDIACAILPATGRANVPSCADLLIELRLPAGESDRADAA